MPSRDSRAEARKAWARLRMYLPYGDRVPFRPAIMLLLESLARREYEAGARDGLKAFDLDVAASLFTEPKKLDRKGARCFGCCGCRDFDSCQHTKRKCEECVKRDLAVKAQARRRG